MESTNHTIKITPALLLDSKDDLSTMLQIYLEVGFKSIDIDIQETPFASDDTLTFESAWEVVTALGAFDKVDLGWDIKAATPETEVKSIFAATSNCRAYVYPGADLEFIGSLTPAQRNKLGLGLLGMDNIKTDFDYNQFPEIQIMSIDEETQGGQIDVRLLDKISKLRDVGYTGKIAIDGGVNENTAALIRRYAPDRVSVGSYFQASSDDLIAAYDRLSQALNS